MSREGSWGSPMRGLEEGVEEGDLGMKRMRPMVRGGQRGSGSVRRVVCGEAGTYVYSQTCCGCCGNLVSRSRCIVMSLAMRS